MPSAPTDSLDSLYNPLASTAPYSLYSPSPRPRSLKNRQKLIHTVGQRYKLRVRYRFFKFFGRIVRSSGHVRAYLRADLDRRSPLYVPRNGSPISSTIGLE